MFNDMKKLMMQKERFGEEQVFVVPTNVFSHINDGFTVSGKKKETHDEYDSLGRFIYRYEAEGSSSFLQLIPYVIIYKPETSKYYVYTRKHGSGEQRLLHQKSIGFGGHINPQDGPSSVVANGMRRELNEELSLNLIGDPKFIGFTKNLDSDLNDHIGFIYIAEVHDASIKKEEEVKYEGEWLTKDQLENEYFKFESWGKFLISYLVDGHSNK